MKAGLEYELEQPLHSEVPSDEQLYHRMLDVGTWYARKYHLDNPEEEAQDAAIYVVLERRYQDRWKPGKGSVYSWLYGMVQRRMVDAQRRQARAKRWVEEAELTRPPGAAFASDPRNDTSEPGQLDCRLEELDSLITLEALRQRLAGDPFFSELLDTVAGRALAGEPMTNKDLGAHLGCAPVTAKKWVRELQALVRAQTQE